MENEIVTPEEVVVDIDTTVAENAPVEEVVEAPVVEEVVEEVL